jgi:formylglycine-generating enzyme required for sulfatase activity
MKSTENQMVFWVLLVLVLTMGCASLKNPAVPGPAFVEIKGGKFTMGLPSGKDKGNAFQHDVTVSDFYLCAYEVTQKEYVEVMGFNPSGVYAPDLPVDYVSWYDAVEFCNKLSKKHRLKPAYHINGATVKWDRNANGYRLPTEAEWEYACRGGTKTLYYVDIEDLPEQDGPEQDKKEQKIVDEKLRAYANFATEDPFWNQGKIVIGGNYPPNKLGLYDMLANVYEWCWDWFAPYTSENTKEEMQIDPIGPPCPDPDVGDVRVLRGGCYFTWYKSLRSGNRDFHITGLRWKGNGIRLARNR